MTEKTNRNTTYFLRDELSRRLQRNPRYSLRAFARSLGIHPGSLSALLRGKRPLTEKAARRFFQKLEVGPEIQGEILKSLNEALSLPKASWVLNRVELEQEIFRVISDWYHYGILQILRTDSYKKIPAAQQKRWMSRQLKVSESEIALALERLLELSLIEKEVSGRFKRTHRSVTTAQKDLTSAGLKKWQRQIREKSIESLENDPIGLRSHTSMTMAIDPRKISEAKKLIDEFQERLGEFLESGKKEKVYQLEISLFPLQIMENQK